jgi:hypothetical protein
MKRETWEFLKFHVLLGVKLAGRLTIAPYVGAYHGVMAEKKRLDAEIAEFNAKQIRMHERGDGA